MMAPRLRSTTPVSARAGTGGHRPGRDDPGRSSSGSDRVCGRGGTSHGGAARPPAGGDQGQGARGHCHEHGSVEVDGRLEPGQGARPLLSARAWPLSHHAGGWLSCHCAPGTSPKVWGPDMNGHVSSGPNAGDGTTGPIAGACGSTKRVGAGTSGSGRAFRHFFEMEP